MPETCTFKTLEPCWHLWDAVYVQVIVILSALLTLLLPLAFWVFARHEVRHMLASTRKVLLNVLVWFGAVMHMVAIPVTFVDANAGESTEGACIARAMVSFLAPAVVFLGVALRIDLGCEAQTAAERRKRSFLVAAQTLTFCVSLVCCAVVSLAESGPVPSNWTAVLIPDEQIQPAKHQVSVPACRKFADFSTEALIALYVPLLLLAVICLVGHSWTSRYPTLGTLLLNLVVALVCAPGWGVSQEFPTRATAGLLMGFVILGTEFALPELFRRVRQREQQLYEQNKKPFSLRPPRGKFKDHLFLSREPLRSNLGMPAPEL